MKSGDCERLGGSDCSRCTGVIQSMFGGADLRAAAQHARWVHHCLTETEDFDWLPGDTKSAMLSMANTIVALAATLDPDRREAERAVVQAALDWYDSCPTVWAADTTPIATAVRRWKEQVERVYDGG